MMSVEISKVIEESESALTYGNYDISEQLARKVLAEIENSPDEHRNTKEIAKFKSSATSILGNIARLRGEFYLALEHFNTVLQINLELNYQEALAKVYGSIGLIYRNLSDYPSALNNLQKALDIDEKFNNKRGLAGTFHNIGNVYLNLSDSPRALEYFLKALALNEELGRKDGMAANFGSIGNIYGQSAEYEQALENYTRAFAINTELGRKSGIASNYGNLGLVHKHMNDFARALEYLQKALASHEELGNISGIAITFGNIGTLYSETSWDGFDIGKAEEFLLKAIELCSTLGAKNNMYAFHKSLAEVYEQEERWKESQIHFKQYHFIEKEVLTEEAKKQAEVQDYQRKEAEREKTLAIARARAQATDDILANILPSTIIERLIKGEKKIADTHESVSVLFVDIVGFTELSARIPANELIDVLDIVFTRFDTICKKNGLEKIKTIGDAYMAVCGAPIAHANHAEQVAKAALEMLEECTITGQFSIPINIEYRIGLHSGSVVAGVIGENKYSYDLWGDAVNTASRMESHGEAGKIHVSEDFVNAVGADNYLPLHFTPRGMMDIKGKGKMKTYFLLQSVAH
ncbi:MAG: tetratricopeptide repeat protein [Ignavibacteria bacterium]|nr:tetratricopeptide repeat protein [Ignavibacteria bacterium]